jgi:ABC-2 type transport system ATP-binding protein
MSAILEMQNVSKEYHKPNRLALDHLSLTVDAGSIYAFVGPNGAGKTTAIRIISTLLAYDSGSVRVAGYEVTSHPRAVRQLIGYIPDEFGLYDDMLVGEYLEFFARCYGIASARWHNLVNDLLELVSLAGRRDDPVSSLSRGMRQRLGLARALLNDPELIVADEPAASLDPRARFELREILRLLCDMGKTIFISSHILRELDDIASHMGIIEGGKILISGLLEKVRRTLQSQLKVRISLLSDADNAQAWLAQHTDVKRVYPATEEIAHGMSTEPDSTLIMWVDGDKVTVSQILSDLIAMQFPVYSYTVEQDNLERIYLQLTQESIV